jgi:hypothetical protein
MVVLEIIGYSLLVMAFYAGMLACVLWLPTGGSRRKNVSGRR